MYEPHYDRLLDWVCITVHHYEETRGDVTEGNTGHCSDWLDRRIGCILYRALPRNTRVWTSDDFSITHFACVDP